MKKSLSKTLSVLIFLTMTLSLDNPVCATALSNKSTNTVHVKNTVTSNSKIVSKKEQSAKLTESNITVTNNVRKADTVTVDGLASKDIIKVYADEEKKILLGKATAIKAGTLVVKLSKQLSTEKVYVTITNNNKTESDTLAVAVKAQAKSNILSDGSVVVAKNVGKADTVTVNELSAKDIIKVYADSDKKTLLGTATALKNGTIVVKLAKKLDPSIEKIYVTVTNDNKMESDPLAVEVTDQISITESENTITVSGLKEKDVVKVYADEDKKTLINTVTAVNGGSVIISLETILNSSIKKVYVTVTSDNKAESNPTTIKIEAQGKSDKLNSDDVKISNIGGKPATLTIYNLSSKEVIKIYGDEDKKILLDTISVINGGSAILTLDNLSKSPIEKIYVTVTNHNKTESDPLAVDVKTNGQAQEQINSGKLTADSVKVGYVAGNPNTLTFYTLSSKDIIKIYADKDKKKLLKTDSIVNGGVAIISLEGLLDSSMENIYVTVTNAEKESDPLAVTLKFQTKSNKLSADAVKVGYIAGSPNTLTLYGLSSKDVIKIYADEDKKTLLNKFSAGNGWSAIVSLEKLLDSSIGKVYITVTNGSKTESDPLAVTVRAN